MENGINVMGVRACCYLYGGVVVSERIKEKKKKKEEGRTRRRGRVGVGALGIWRGR